MPKTSKKAGFKPTAPAKSKETPGKGPETGATGAEASPAPNPRQKAKTPAQPKYINGQTRLPGEPIQWDLARLKALGVIHCTHKEVAAVLGVSLKAVDLELAKEDSPARAAFQSGMDEGKMSLRRVQVQQAMSGNTTMLIWLGKQILGQRDPSAGGATAKLENEVGRRMVLTVNLGSELKDEDGDAGGGK